MAFGRDEFLVAIDEIEDMENYVDEQSKNGVIEPKLRIMMLNQLACTKLIIKAIFAQDNDYVRLSRTSTDEVEGLE